MYYTLMYNLCLCSPVVRKYELGSAQTITRNKRMLTERDFIEKEGYVFSDPVFGLWFKREYC